MKVIQGGICFPIGTEDALFFLEKHENPIHLFGCSTDSAGFPLLAAVQMRTNLENINNGMLYLRPGLEEERFLAPYYWSLPAISCLGSI